MFFFLKNRDAKQSCTLHALHVVGNNVVIGLLRWLAITVLHPCAVAKCAQSCAVPYLCRRDFSKKFETDRSERCCNSLHRPTIQWADGLHVNCPTEILCSYRHHSSPVQYAYCYSRTQLCDLRQSPARMKNRLRIRRRLEGTQSENGEIDKSIYYCYFSTLWLLELLNCTPLPIKRNGFSVRIVSFATYAHTDAHSTCARRLLATLSFSIICLFIGLLFLGSVRRSSPTPIFKIA